jgi:hypothetical protein
VSEPKTPRDALALLHDECTKLAEGFDQGTTARSYWEGKTSGVEAALDALAFTNVNGGMSTERIEQIRKFFTETVRVERVVSHDEYPIYSKVKSWERRDGAVLVDELLAEIERLRVSR